MRSRVKIERLWHRIARTRNQGVARIHLVRVRKNSIFGFEGNDWWHWGDERWLLSVDWWPWLKPNYSNGTEKWNGIYENSIWGWDVLKSTVGIFASFWQYKLAVFDESIGLAFSLGVGTKTWIVKA